MSTVIPETVARDWHGDSFVTTVARYSGDRAPSGLLITGPAGIGKEAFALHLVRQVLGRERSVPEQLEGLPDFQRVSPEEDGKAILVDPVRQLEHFVRLTASGGGFKFVLLTPADALNRSAANALLKTLEEPPPRSTLLLVTARPAALLPTVRSRCQQIALKAPDRAQALAFLKARFPEVRDIEPVLALARGAPGVAARWLADGVHEDMGAVAEVFDGLLKRRLGVTGAGAELTGRSVAVVAEMAVQLVENLLQSRFSDEESGAFGGKLMESLRHAAADLNLTRAFGAYDRLLVTRQHLLEASGLRDDNLLEDLCAALTMLRPARTRA